MTDKLIDETGSSVTQRLRRGGLWIVLGRTAGMGTVFAILILLARWLPQDEFASYVATSSLVVLSAVAAMFGLNQLVCRYVAAFIGVGNQQQAARAVFHIALLAFLTILVTACIILLASKTISERINTPELLHVIGFVVIWILLLAISQLIAEALRGLHQLLAASLFAGISGGLVANAILLGMILAGHANDNLNYEYVVASAMISSIFPILASGIWLFRTWPKKALSVPSQLDKQLPPSEFRGILSQAFPIMLLSFSALGFDKAGQLISKAFGNDLIVGSFEIAWQLGFLGIVPLTMLGLASASTISESYARGDKKILERVLQSVSTASSLVSLPLLLLLMFFGSSIIGVLKPEYVIGAKALFMFGLVQIVRNWMGPCDVTLVMTGNQLWALLGFVVASPVLALGPWAVSNYGIDGMAVVIATSVLISRTIQYIVLRFRLGVKPNANFSPQFILGLMSTIAIGRNKKHSVATASTNS